MGYHLGYHSPLFAPSLTDARKPGVLYLLDSRRVSRVGLEPTTYGLKELGGMLTSALGRSINGCDTRGRSLTIIGAVTVFGTVSRRVPDPENPLAPQA